MGDKSEISDEGSSLDGIDLVHVLTTFPAIKPLDPIEDSGVSLSPSSSVVSAFSPPQVDHTYNNSSLLSTASSPSSQSVFLSEASETSRKRGRVKDEKVCGICGDKALGFNFNAITCESCKAFFRRNALKPKPSCLFTGKCVIDTKTRRFCPACRIHKCFDIGMNPDMILDDSEKKARMERVVENRNKKYIYPLPLETVTVKVDHTASLEDPPSSASFEIPVPLAMTSAIRVTASQSPAMLKVPSRQYGLPHTVQGRMFKHPPRELLPSDPQFYRRLTEDEKWMLNDISSAFQATIAVFNGAGSSPEPPKPNPSLNELINSTDETVRQLIRFVGRISDFQQMRKDDQISCLKNSVMQSVLLRSACVYILEKDVFLCSKGEVPTTCLQSALENPTLCAAHVNFCRSIKSIILNNYTMWALAQILALFNPCGSGLLDREMLSSLQDKYIVLLKHYLESEFAFTFAQDYMVALQDMLGDLRTLGEAYTTVIYNVNPTEIEPLLLEVFNLK